MLSAMPEPLQSYLHSLLWYLRNDVDGYDDLAINRLHTFDTQFHRAVADDTMEVPGEVLNVLLGYLHTLSETTPKPTRAANKNRSTWFKALATVVLHWSEQRCRGNLRLQGSNYLIKLYTCFSLQAQTRPNAIGISAQASNHG